MKPMVVRSTLLALAALLVAAPAIAQAPPRPAAPPRPEGAPPPPPPGGPPPVRGAAVILDHSPNGFVHVDVHCAEAETTRACVEIASQLYAKLNGEVQAK